MDIIQAVQHFLHQYFELIVVVLLVLITLALIFRSSQSEYEYKVALIGARVAVKGLREANRLGWEVIAMIPFSFAPESKPEDVLHSDWTSLTQLIVCLRRRT